MLVAFFLRILKFSDEGEALFDNFSGRLFLFLTILKILLMRGSRSLVIYQNVLVAFCLWILKFSNEGEALFHNFMGSSFVPFHYCFKDFPD